MRTRLALLPLLLSSTAFAQTPPSPAQMGLSPTSPQTLSVFDNARTWRPFGMTMGGGLALESRPTINALLYGVDPTGANDSTLALRSAFLASQYYGVASPSTPVGPGACVHLPAGKYKITDAITPDRYSGCFYGDGRTQTYLMVNSATFNLSAQGAIVLGATAGATSELHDFDIMLTQPDVPNRASLPNMPPAIYAQSAGRPIFTNLRMGGGWGTCIDARGNSGGIFYTNIECNALKKGLMLDGGLDGGHISNWHHWFFDGNTTTQPGLYAIWRDGTTICMEIGRYDGLMINNPQCFFGNMVWTTNSTGTADANMVTNAMLDGAQILQMASGGEGNFFSNLNFARNGSMDMPSIVLQGGNLTVTNYWVSQPSNASAPAIQQTGGNFLLSNGTLGGGTLTHPYATITGGSMSITNAIISSPQGSTVPVIEQIGGALKFTNNRFSAPPSGGTGIGVAFDVDNTVNMFADNIMLGWGMTTTGTLGQYGFYLAGSGYLTTKNPVEVQTLKLTHTGPRILLHGTGTQPLDQHDWDIFESSATGDLQFRSLKDDGTQAAAPLVFKRNTGWAGPTPVLATTPTAAGTGGLFVCIDTTGALYKKATCP